ncbi:MAG TPA: RHS repeat-associated core domain-containing protein, partial [Verrucomicrobiae bacterium]|nr:RHS repeat-associated core domain-containing protein [Verrucomicrobiae bacterium]
MAPSNRMKHRLVIFIALLAWHSFGNGVAFPSSVQTINSYYDPLVEFLELGVSYGAKTEWKLYGPDLSGQYGGLNGIGGLDGTSPGLSLFNPTISDIRGDILGYFDSAAGSNTWNSARPTGYGAVPNYRPVALASGGTLAQSSSWRGRWVDVTGYYNIGLRPYDPVSGRWLTYDSAWNGRDPNYYTFCGGDPINGFDPDGRCIEGITSAANFGIGIGQGALQGFTGISTGQPTTTANYNGQLDGRDLSAAISLWMTIDGAANTGTGAGIMAVSGTAEAVTVGGSTPVTGPTFLG